MVSSALAQPKEGPAPVLREGALSTPVQVPGAGGPSRPPADYGDLVHAIIGVDPENHDALLSLVRDGLPASVIKRLEIAYGATQSEIAQALRIPMTTLRRRLRQNEQLTVDESDRVIRLARIKDLALGMMHGDDQAAVAWLRTPREILGNESPMVRANTEVGAREVEDLIGRIRHGVFS